MAWTQRRKVIVGVAGAALAIGGVVGIGATVAANSERSASQSDVLDNEDREWVVSPDAIRENDVSNPEDSAAAHENVASDEELANGEDVAGNSLTVEQIQAMLTACPEVERFYPDAADQIAGLPESEALFLQEKVRTDPELVEGMLLSLLK